MTDYTAGGTLNEEETSATLSFLDAAGNQADLSYGDGNVSVVNSNRLYRSNQDPRTYLSADGQMGLTLTSPYAPNNLSIQTLSAMVHIAALGTNPLMLTPLEETAAGSNRYEWKLEDSRAGSGGSYVGWDVEVKSVAPSEESGGYDYQPMALKFEGPDELLAATKTVEMFGEKLNVVKSDAAGGYFVASQMEPDKPATIVVVNTPRVQLEDLVIGEYPQPPSDPNWVDEPDDGVGLGDLEYMRKYMDKDHDGEVSAADFLAMIEERAASAARMYGDADFYKGILHGLLGNPVDSIADLAGLIEGGVKLSVKAVKLAATYNPLGFLCKVIYEFGWGDRFEGEISTAKRAWDNTAGWAKEVAGFIKKIYDQGADALAQAMMHAADDPFLKTLSKPARIAVDIVFMLLTAGEEAWNNLGNYKKGYGVGYVAAEAVISGIAALVTAPAGGSGALVTLGRYAPKLLKFFEMMRPAIQKLIASASHYADVGVWFDKLMDMLKLTKAQKWCFIAGTPVMTMAGPIPIEQIEPGMMVWSAPESGEGAGCYRPVLETYRNDATEVWSVSYDHDRNPATQDQTLTASSGHPFWVEERHAFVKACELAPGDHLRLGSTGTTTPVTRLSSKLAGGGRSIPVFNLAVADYHTYYAGVGGVWVHNLCSEALERYAADFDVLFKKFKEANPGNDAQAWKKALDEIKSAADSTDKLKWVETNEALGYIAKKSTPKEALWNLVADTDRGNYIEAALAKIEYDDWWHIAQNDKWFPLIDFQKRTEVISVKSIKTTGSTWVERISKHIDELGKAGITVDDVPVTKKILDIRVEPGGASAPGLAKLRTAATNAGADSNC